MSEAADDEETDHDFWETVWREFLVVFVNDEKMLHQEQIDKINDYIINRVRWLLIVPTFFYKVGFYVVNLDRPQAQFNFYTFIMDLLFFIMLIVSFFRYRRECIVFISYSFQILLLVRYGLAKGNINIKENPNRSLMFLCRMIL